MAQPEVSNPNDFKVVTLTNKEAFAFTPELGCTYDSRPIFGTSGTSGIQPGESVVLPYHIGNLLAQNLAKIAMIRRSPTVDPQGIPTGVPLWDETKLAALKASYLTDLYTEQRPAPVSETDRLMAKVEELQKFVEDNIGSKTPSAPEAPKAPVAGTEPSKEDGSTELPKKYQDKAEIIAELTKRGIKFDPRSTRDVLKKLLV